MKRRAPYRLLILVLLSPVLLGNLACDDENGPTVGFRLDLTVVQPNDEPAGGIEVRLHVPIPGLVFKEDEIARRARTVCQVVAPQEARQVLEVYDLEGRLVRRIFDARVSPGLYSYAFNGETEEGETLLGTHVLEFRFRAHATETDSLLFEARHWATMYTGIDLEQTHLLGVTNTRGRLTVTDPSLFPGIYDLPEMEMRDENGQPLGTFQFGDEVHFVLSQAGVAGYDVNPREVTSGISRLKLTWVPPASSSGSNPGFVGPTESGLLRSAPIDPPLEWEFHPNYPNPFN